MKTMKTVNRLEYDKIKEVIQTCQKETIEVFDLLKDNPLSYAAKKAINVFCELILVKLRIAALKESNKEMDLEIEQLLKGYPDLPRS